MSEGSIVVLDTSRSLREVLWHVGDLPGPMLACTIGAEAEAYLFDTVDEWEVWSYRTGARRSLSQRQSIAPDASRPPALHQTGQLLQFGFAQEQDRFVLRYRWHDQPRECVLDLGGDRLHSLDWVMLKDFVAVLIASEHRHVFLLRPEYARCVAQVCWPGDGAALGLRDQDECVLLFDDSGRVLDIDLATSTQQHVSTQ